jgi:acyl dehydratase
VRTFRGIGELRAAVGAHLGHSSWLTVSQADVDTFADVTGDHQWIHVDRNRAATGPFGGTIVHGYLTLSRVQSFLDEVLRIEGVAMLVNYGCDRVRFPTPVPTGSRLRGGVELTGLQETPRGHQLTARVTVEVEGAPKPACVVDTITLVLL